MMLTATLVDQPVAGLPKPVQVAELSRPTPMRKSPLPNGAEDVMSPLSPSMAESTRS